MKKTILSIAVIAAAFVAASCQKENLLENNATEGSASVFTATIESGASTKTTVERVDGTKVIYKTKWESTDKININAETYTATPDGTDATKAIFTPDGSEPGLMSGKYYVVYPASLYVGGPGFNTQLPASYSYADGQYNMPMYAESTTTSLSFKNLCGVLAITVKGTDFTSVSSFEVSSDKQMNGEFTATADGALSFISKTLEDADKKVTLDFGTAKSKSIASDGSATFYIPVPPATNHTLTIKVSDGSTTKIMVTKKSGGVEVARNTVYPIAFNGQPIAGTAKATIGGSEVDVNWVQLWENGPKFAEYNVGATSATETGSKMNFTNATKAGAEYVWGANWCTPSKDQMNELLLAATSPGSSKVKCDYTSEGGQYGFKFTGKETGYTGNSVFFPAPDGNSNGGGGDYWSASAADSGKAWEMQLLYDGGIGAWNSNWYSDGQGREYLVRPVFNN